MSPQTAPLASNWSNIEPRRGADHVLRYYCWFELFSLFAVALWFMVTVCDETPPMPCRCLLQAVTPAASHVLTSLLPPGFFYTSFFIIYLFFSHLHSVYQKPLDRGWLFFFLLLSFNSSKPQPQSSARESRSFSSFFRRRFRCLDFRSNLTDTDTSQTISLVAAMRPDVFFHAS